MDPEPKNDADDTDGGTESSLSSEVKLQDIQDMEVVKAEIGVNYRKTQGSEQIAGSKKSVSWPEDEDLVRMREISDTPQSPKARFRRCFFCCISKPEEEGQIPEGPEGQEDQNVTL